MDIAKNIIDYWYSTMLFGMVFETGKPFIYKKGLCSLFTDTLIKIKMKAWIDDENIEAKEDTIKFTTNLLYQVKNHLHSNLKYLKDFDKQKWRINCLNGLVDLRDGFYNPHFQFNETPYLSFVQIPVEYDKDAECLVIDQFLADVFGFDRVPLIYEIISYLLYKSNKLHKSFIFFGEASSGKTSFIEMIRIFLGANNITDISIQDLNKRFQMANLKDKMANIYDDLPVKKLNYIANFKQVVTNNSLTGELKGVQGSLTWDNFCKLVFTTNNLPEVADNTGEDFWRRIMLIHCTQHFDNGSKDFDIIDKITCPKELSGLLNKCIQYFPKLMERKHFEEKYDDIDTVKGIWQININPLKLFLDECCVITDNNNDYVDDHIFRRQLNAFRKERNAAPISLNLITRRLKDLGVDKKQKSDGNRYYIGIKITKTIIDKIESIILGGSILDEF